MAIFFGSIGRTRLDLSAIGKAFEAEVGRGWGAKTGWRWEDEDAAEWEPIRAVKARLRDLDRKRQDQASDVLHKVKLSLVSFKTFTNSTVVRAQVNK